MDYVSKCNNDMVIACHFFLHKMTSACMAVTFWIRRQNNRKMGYDVAAYRTFWHIFFARSIRVLIIYSTGERHIYQICMGILICIIWQELCHPLWYIYHRSLYSRPTLYVLWVGKHSLYSMQSSDLSPLRMECTNSLNIDNTVWIIM